MATYTGTEIVTEARAVHLNDANAAVFTNAALLPILISKYEDLQDDMEGNDVPVVNEISAAIAITAVTQVNIPPGGGAGQLPTDLIRPVFLEERAVGETFWTPMIERAWEPDIAQGSSLVFWVWREEEIKLIGALIARQVRIKYVKALPTITLITDLIRITGSKQYLAAAVAAQAALTIGRNQTLADAIASIANDQYKKLMNNFARKNQSLPVRRRGWTRPRGIWRY